VTIQTTLPKTFPLRLKSEEVDDSLEEMACLVDGGTMSLRAVTRSYSVSSVGKSDSTDEREAEEDVREDAGEP